MRLPIVFTITVLAFALALAVVVVPAAVVAWAERQSWPRRLRLLRAAYYLELASAGVAGVSMLDATVVDLALGDQTKHFALRTAAHDHVGLRLDASASPSDLSQLRYWWAEAIPVLLIERGCHDVGVYGPSGVVRAQWA